MQTLVYDTFRCMFDNSILLNILQYCKADINLYLTNKKINILCDIVFDVSNYCVNEIIERCIEKNKIETIYKILKNPKIKNKIDCELIIDIVRYNNIGLVREFINSPNIRPSCIYRNQTLLLRISCISNFKIFKLLLDNELIDPFNDSKAIYYIFRNSKEKYINYIVKHPYINKNVIFDVFLKCCRKNLIKCVKILLKLNIDDYLLQEGLKISFMYNSIDVILKLMKISTLDISLSLLIYKRKTRRSRRLLRIILDDPRVKIEDIKQQFRNCVWFYNRKMTELLIRDNRILSLLKNKEYFNSFVEDSCMTLILSCVRLDIKTYEMFILYSLEKNINITKVLIKDLGLDCLKLSRSVKLILVRKIIFVYLITLFTNYEFLRLLFSGFVLLISLGILLLKLIFVSS